jgi:hypothetical protein
MQRFKFVTIFVKTMYFKCGNRCLSRVVPYTLIDGRRYPSQTSRRHAPEEYNFDGRRCENSNLKFRM